MYIKDLKLLVPRLNGGCAINKSGMVMGVDFDDRLNIFHLRL